jgi:hypothetical protein
MAEDDFLESLVVAHQDLAERLERDVHTVMEEGALQGEDPRVELGALERVLREHRADLERLHELRRSEMERYDEMIKDREAGIRDLERRMSGGKRAATRQPRTTGRRDGGRKPGK